MITASNYSVRSPDKTPDYLFRQNLSPMAQEACAIVSQIRFEEQQTLWTKEYEDTLLTDHVDVFPGMMFSLAKERMEKSKLWQIVRKMPKGALLHCHLEAMVDLDWALEEAFNAEGICIVADSPITDDTTRRKTGFSFTYSKDAKVDISIWDDSYTVNTPVPLNQAADTFPGGGKTAFVEWIRSRVTITASEHLSHHEGPNEVWRKFMSCFPILGSLIYYEPIFRKFIRRMCKGLVEDGVFYVDLRTAFYTPYRSTKKEDWDADHFNMLEHLADEIEKFKASEEGKDFWGARMIWTTIRQFGKKQVIESKLPNICKLWYLLYTLPRAVSVPVLTVARYEAMHRDENRVSGNYRRLRLGRPRRPGSSTLRPRPRVVLVPQDLRSRRCRHSFLLPCW